MFAKVHFGVHGCCSLRSHWIVLKEDEGREGGGNIYTKSSHTFMVFSATFYLELRNAIASYCTSHFLGIFGATTNIK